MGNKYDHFSLEERCRLRGLMEMGLGASEIARRLGRHRGTIYREIARNRCASGYRPDSADRMAWVRKLRGSKIQRFTRLGDYVGDRLAMVAITSATALPWDGRRKRSPDGWSLTQ